MSNALYAVIGGEQVRYSKSPFIHMEFAKQTGQDIEYRAISLPVNINLAASLEELQQKGFCGLNITMPFKETAYAVLSARQDAMISERAQLARAINTVKFSKQGWLGDNTDGVGLVQDILQNLSWPIKNKALLICGAGGAVRGIIAPLLQCSPSKLVLANRTLAKAESLAKEFIHLGAVTVSTFAELQDKQFDMLINGIAVGNLSPLPAEICAKQSYCYDMAYGKSEETTAFLQWARATSAVQCVDGLGMLVEQAAESFFIWHGIKPKTSAILKMLRSI